MLALLAAALCRLVFWFEGGLHHCGDVFGARHFFLVFLFTGLLGQEGGSRDRGQKRGNGGFFQLGLRTRVAVGPLHFDGIKLLNVLYEDGIVFATEGAAGIVALFLGGRDLAVQTAGEVNEFGVVVEVRFRVIGVGEFLKENLGEAGGGGLETDFGQLRGIVAAEEIQEVILI